MKKLNLRRKFLKFLLKIFYHGIQLKAAVVIFSVLGATILGGGLISMVTSQSTTKKTVIDKHEAIVRQAAEEINQMLRRHADTLAAAAAIIGVLDADPWRQETILVELVLKHPAFIHVSSLDMDCKKIASSELGTDRKYSCAPSMLKKILAGQTHVSNIHFHDGSIPYLSFGVPIKKEGSVRGLLIADIDIKDLWKVADGIRVGKSGYAAVISGDGTVIAHQDKKLVFKKESLAGQKDVTPVLSGKSGSVEWKDTAGVFWLSSYAPVGPGSWGVVLRQERDEALLSLRLLEIQMLIIIVLGLIIAAGLSVFLGGLFVRPLHLLVVRARKMGVVIEPAKLRRQDEIRQLVRIFDEFSARLKEEAVNKRFSGIGEATAWVVHELKNSLFSIKSFVKLFPERRNDEKFMSKFSVLIPEEIERLERMLRELADSSKHPQFIKVPVNVKDVVIEVIGVTEESLKQKEIILQHDIKEERLFVPGNADMLKTVFLNLIINAAAAMPSGGQIKISAELINSASDVEVRISDTGAGIPAERLREIFEPFESTKKDGDGLGLSISRRIIQQHAGQIRADSSPGKGTVFTITLPSLESWVEEVKAKAGLRNN